MPALVDYEVHIPRGGQTDALTGDYMQSESATKPSVDSNQVMAAVKATLRMVNLKLSI